MKPEIEGHAQNHICIKSFLIKAIIFEKEAKIVIELDKACLTILSAKIQILV